jgi:hypothetical protein
MLCSSRTVAGGDAAAVAATLPPAARRAAGDLRTRGVAGLPPVREGRAGLEDERLHLRVTPTEDPGDISVGETDELREHERASLLRGQVAHVGQQGAELRSPLDFVRERPRRDQELRRIAGARSPSPQLGKAAIAGHGEQPRL